MKTLLALALVMMMAGSAEALNNFNGHQMIKFCFGRNGSTLTDRMISSTYCNGYIDGILNPATFLLNNLGSDPTFCIPEKTTSIQVQDIIKKYLDDNPRLLHQFVPFLISLAMQKEFPCRGK